MNSLPTSRDFSQQQLPTLEQVRAERLRRSTRYVAAASIEESRERCRTLVGFIKEAWHVVEPGVEYVHGKHIDFIAMHLEAVTFDRLLAMGLDNRLLLNIPPGTMKSLMTSVFWPAWEWGPAAKPWLRYLTASFAERFARRDSRKMRDLVQSEWYRERWPEVELVRDGEMSFSNSRGGSRDAVPFASMTGGRGDRVIVDDPHSTETAESDAERETTIRIFTESVTERLNDKVKSAILVDMQRLHQKDVSGIILDRKLPYQKIILPMEFERDRPCVTALGRDWRTQEDELLFPERFPREVVERDKATLGSHAVAAQYQQRPAPRGGLLFKRAWFRVIPAAPVSGVRWVRGWDLAATATQTAAWTVGTKLGRSSEGRFIIGHIARAQETPAEVRKLIRNTAEQDGRAVQVDIPQDPGQAGKVQAQDLVALLAGYVVYTSPETGDKWTRAQPFAAQAEAGNVDLVEGPWNEAYLAEIEAFPTGKFVDQVDATSRAFGRLVLVPGHVYATPIMVTAPSTSFGDHPGL